MIKQVTLRVHVHATESEEKVRKALAFVAGRAAVETTSAKGYYGNPIRVMVCTLKKRADISAFFARLRENGVLQEVLLHLEERVDEDGVLHMRFDKQEAYMGRLKLVSGGDVISVRCRVVCYPGTELLPALREYLEGN